MTIALIAVVVIGIVVVAYARHRVLSDPDRYPPRVRDGALTPTATPAMQPPATNLVAMRREDHEDLDMAIVRGVRASYDNLPYRRFDR